jgi:cystathionine beta-lyase
MFILNYNFDKVIDRKGTDSIKWSFRNNDDSIALGWADMDFHTPQAVTDAVSQVAGFGLYGYVAPGPGWYDPFIMWCGRHYHWQVKEEWLSYTPGVISALGSAVRAFTQKGDQVIFQTPAFCLFTELTETNDREVVPNPLIYEDGKYTIDFEDLEAKAKKPKAKMLILCNPHNPTGRVFTKEELTRIGEICVRNNVIIASDEVHCDMVYKPHQHICIASISEAIAQNTITCLSPSKTFNMAGLQISVNVISTPQMREKYSKELVSRDSKRPNIFGMAAFRAAYESGEEWLEKLLAYIKGNLDYLTDYLEKNIPSLKVVRPEGTYLAWIDCTGLGLSGQALGDFFAKNANIFISSGIGFGVEGTSFIRVNLACPRSTIRETLDRMKKAIRPK